MPIDFSYLDGAAPQRENTSTNSETVSVTIRVDAECLLHCDGKFVDIQLKAGVIAKTKLPVGKHLLEFMSLEASGIKVEKDVDFPEVGKNYLVLISDLSKSIEAKKKAEAIKKAELEAEAEAKRKAEEEAQRLAEEAKRKAAEEEARIKAEAEEKAKRKAEEEAKRMAEEEAEAKRKARAEAEAKNGVLNGHDYVDLGLPSGLKWATCNVGADSSERYGCFYAWGEVEPKELYKSDTYIKRRKRPNDISGNPTYDVARAKWGSSWRMPTIDEFQELIDECKWKRKKVGWNEGYIVSGPNGNSIFLPLAGYKHACCVLCDRWSGHYWSSTRERSLYFNSSAAREVTNSSSYYGHNVRPVFGVEPAAVVSVPDAGDAVG